MVYDANRTPLTPEQVERIRNARKLRTALTELVGWAEDDLKLPLIDIASGLQHGANNVLTVLLRENRKHGA